MVKKVKIITLIAAFVMLLQGCAVMDAISLNSMEKNAPTFGTKELSNDKYKALTGVELVSTNEEDDSLFSTIAYIVKDDNLYQYSNNAMSYDNNIRTDVRLDPYFFEAQGSKGKSMFENNLDSILQSSLSDARKDYSLSQLVENGNGYSITEKYMEQSTSFEHYKEYVPCYVFYYMEEFDNGHVFVLTVEIHVDDTEDEEMKTRTIQELEHFYQIDIDWTKEVAEQQAKDYEHSPEKDMNIQVNADMIMEFPQGWEQFFYSNSENTYRAYALNGNPNKEQRYIQIDSGYIFGEGFLDNCVSSEKKAKQYIEDVYKGEWDLISYGTESDSIFENAIYFEIANKENPKKAAKVYICENDSEYIYIMAMDCTEDHTECFDAAESIVKNSKFQ